METAKVVHLTSAHPALDLRIFHKECRTLARAGFRVTIIGRHATDSVVDGVQIKAIPAEKRRLARMTRLVWRVYREALRQNADLYHFHDPELIPVGLLLRAAGKRVIYDVHEDVPKDILSKYYLPGWSRHLLSWAVRQVQSVSCRHFSAIVAVTPTIAERFRAINDRTVTVHNFPYIQEFVKEGAPWEERLPAVAYIGGITAQRGIREMVLAMALLPKWLPATLEMAGNRVPEHAHPEELYRHPGWARVRHHGTLDRKGVFDLLSRVRAGLVLFHPKPNHREAMPHKLFEYMGAGLPVIASDFPFWRQMFGGTGCAIFVDPLDPTAIAGAIEYVLTHPHEAARMGKQGQAAVLNRYNWETEERELVNLYSGLVEPVCAG